jgi:hypothetical protein
MICDLPSLAHQLLYFIRAPPDGPWNEDQGAQVQSAQDDFQVYDGLGEIVLQCQWNIAHIYYRAHRRPFDSGCIAFVGDLREVPRWFEVISQRFHSDLCSSTCTFRTEA